MSDATTPLSRAWQEYRAMHTYGENSHMLATVIDMRLSPEDEIAYLKRQP